MPLHWPALITLLCIVLLFVLSLNVSLARGKFKIAAPATTGNIEFERAYRVHMNSVEATVLFLPALWLATLFHSPRFAAIVGAVWLAARVWYALGYASGAGRRNGYMLAAAAWAVLVVVASYGVIRNIVLFG